MALIKMKYFQQVRMLLSVVVILFALLVYPLNIYIVSSDRCERLSNFIFYGWPPNAFLVKDLNILSYESVERCIFFVDRSVFSIVLASWMIFSLIWRATKRKNVYISTYFWVNAVISVGLLFVSGKGFVDTYNIIMLSNKDNISISIVKSCFIIFLFYYVLQMTLYMAFSFVKKAIRAEKILR